MSPKTHLLRICGPWVSFVRDLIWENYLNRCDVTHDALECLKEGLKTIKSLKHFYLNGKEQTDSDASNESGVNSDEELWLY